MSKICYGSLLDHLAEYMIYLSTASSFWLSLNSVYDHEFHLSQWLGISPQAYEYLLETWTNEWGPMISQEQEMLWMGPIH